MKKHAFLYFIIFLEGYIVLSTELLAIRQIMPFVGGGTDTTSIIISAVLLPLAAGYYWGGRFKRKSATGTWSTIRSKLVQNIFIATLFLAIGLSYMLIDVFFKTIQSTTDLNRISTTFLYAGIFIVTPVFLLAQTIPLVSHYFNRQELPSTTGKMLFFSTVGSLMGGIFSTLVLMATIGVNLTAGITIICLCFLYILLSKDKFARQSIIILTATIIFLYINSNAIFRSVNIVENNIYNTITIHDLNNGSKVMLLNDTASAGLSKDEETTFPYMQHIEKNFIDPIKTKGSIKSILAIGTGGFTLGLDDNKNNYTFVDIDNSLKNISEQYFLKRKLGDNKKFYALPARSFIKKAKKQKQKFDLIFIDTYLGSTIPEQLVTKEFFENIKDILNEDAIVVTNIIASPSFSNKFSITIDNTLRSVFPNMNRQAMYDYNAWDKSSKKPQNIMYSYFHKKNSDKNYIYTDDKNRVFFDKNNPKE